MKKIGIYGGTFNPVHKGHINCLRSVLDQIKLDKVIILPDRIPPHKSSEDLVSDEDRFNMCKLAFGEFSNAQVDDWELRQTGKSYSVKTLRHFHEVYPECKLYFIMGSDMLLSFEKWYKYDEILKLAALLCVSRDSEDTDEILYSHARKITDECGGEIIIVKTCPFEVSSTQIRQMISFSEDCTCYLDENVVKYIYDKGLYKNSK